jgi:hypothetical protein
MRVVYTFYVLQLKDKPAYQLLAAEGIDISIQTYTKLRRSIRLVKRLLPEVYEAVEAEIAYYL